MANTNANLLNREHFDGGPTAETENLNSVYEFREVLWESDIRPMRSPMFGQIRPEGVGSAAAMNKDS